MAKKTKFNLREALENVNPFLRDGFTEYLMDKKIKDIEEFNKYLRKYGGV